MDSLKQAVIDHIYSEYHDPSMEQADLERIFHDIYGEDTDTAAIDDIWDVMERLALEIVEQYFEEIDA